MCEGGIFIKKIFCALALTFLTAAALPTAAWADQLQVVGEAVGIEMSAEGVFVAGLSTVTTADGSRSPAQEAGLCEGDLIVAVNGVSVSCAADFAEALSSGGGDSACVTALRGGEELNFTVETVTSDSGERMMGLWLRDGVSGIGTVTFRDPETGTFGALGHGISDEQNGELLPLSGGSIYQAQISSIEKGEAGKPGAVSGCIDESDALGQVSRNTACGIYGVSGVAMDGELMDVGEIRLGQADIVSDVGGESRLYSVEINRIYENEGATYALLNVTDEELLSLTGGIVQGMSGSPVVQDGKLVAAVTHVFVSDPRKGYCISIQDMLSAAGIDKAA